MTIALPLETCPMFGDVCRHCSFETTARPHTRIERNPTTGIYKPKGLGKTVVQLGAFCSNINKWVAEMKECPVRWMKVNPPKIKSVSIPKQKPDKKPKISVPPKKNAILPKKKPDPSILKKRVLSPRVVGSGQTQLWFGKRRPK